MSIALYLRAMSTRDLIAEIEKLPRAKRLRLLENALRKLERGGPEKKLERAAMFMRSHYLKDRNLTALTALDAEDFHEAR